MPNIVTTLVGGNGNVASSHTVFIDVLPTQCPLCGVIIVAGTFAQAYIVGNLLEFYARCVNGKCLRSFVAIYERDEGRPQNQYFFSYRRSFPVEGKNLAVSQAVTDISASFVKIYGQAHLAEEHGLDEIAGPGYRKALEFLIKDYAISLQNSEDAKEDIRKIQIGNVIAKYLDGDKLPIVSKRAAWLGNDETHYQRRWVDKDLADLKKLIRAVEHFIAMEVLVKDLPEEMPDPASTLRKP